MLALLLLLLNKLADMRESYNNCHVKFLSLNTVHCCKVYKTMDFLGLLVFSYCLSSH